MTWEPLGDKKNSDFFNEYRLKIYERRRVSGLEDLLGRICGLVVQVDHGDALAYMEEPFSAPRQSNRASSCWSR
jgi:hypothetical protein